jgi:hypothetical protein
MLEQKLTKWNDKLAFALSDFKNLWDIPIRKWLISFGKTVYGSWF